MRRSKPLYKKKAKVLCVRAFQNGNRDNFARVAAPDLLQVTKWVEFLDALYVQYYYYYYYYFYYYSTPLDNIANKIIQHIVTFQIKFKLSHSSICNNISALPSLGVVIKYDLKVSSDWPYFILIILLHFIL